MQIEALEIRNYRLFRDARLTNLPQMVIFVGANGTGKSTFFDIFSFLKEALVQNVAVAVARRCLTGARDLSKMQRQTDLGSAKRSGRNVWRPNALRAPCYRDVLSSSTGCEEARCPSKTY